MTPPDAIQVLRGGSWFSKPRVCRSALRFHDQPDRADSFIGFRVVCLPQEVAPPRMVMRGCSWFSVSRYGHSASRRPFGPVDANCYLGFRVIHLPREIAP